MDIRESFVATEKLGKQLIVASGFIISALKKLRGNFWGKHRKEGFVIKFFCIMRDRGTHVKHSAASIVKRDNLCPSAAARAARLTRWHSVKWQLVAY